MSAACRAGTESVESDREKARASGRKAMKEGMSRNSSVGEGTGLLTAIESEKSDRFKCHCDGQKPMRNDRTSGLDDESRKALRRLFLFEEYVMLCMLWA